MTYYRLYDNQCSRYMASGYNAESKKELFEDYADYKGNDWDNDDEDNMRAYWDSLSDEQKMNFIRDDEFDIEESQTKFEDNN